MKKILLDTNAVSRLMRGDERVAQELADADQVLLPVFVIAELLFGFKKGSKEKENRALLQLFESRNTVHRIYPTAQTAEIFSDVLLKLRKKGTPIPVNDIWIAASALESGSVVVTYDKHFLHLSEVRVWSGLVSNEK